MTGSEALKDEPLLGFREGRFSGSAWPVNHQITLGLEAQESLVEH
jgi:hypothetical protein